ncbi:MAG: hypothetical protein HY010_00460 [Acidobacteria bacterium]|nr:hypothetical protein [Acidobacteriota bacterium]
MLKLNALLLIALLWLCGCSKSAPTSPATGSSASNMSNASAPVSADEPVDKKLQELAGSGATNCGHLKSQTVPEMDAAGKCVMQGAQQKKPFYVAYELPGMIIAIAGNAQGKLFSVQSQPSAEGGLATVPCPAELRIAPSGRATCYSPGTFPMGMDANHGGSMTKPPTGANPHKGLGIPAPGNANPHKTPPAAPAKQS